MSTMEIVEQVAVVEVTTGGVSVEVSDGSGAVDISVLGSQGPTGATGPTGPTGATGPAGADGADGANATNDITDAPITATVNVPGGNYSLVLDGSTNYLSSSDAAFGLNDQFTFCLWLETATLSSNHPFMARWTGGQGILWWSNGGNVLFYLNGSSIAPWTGGTAAINAAGRTHIAVSRDATSLKMYHEGVEVSSAARGNNPSVPSTPFQVGSYANGGGGKTPMEIDHASVYNTGLSGADIATLAAQGNIVTSPLAVWTLNDGAGSTVTDSSGNDYDLTLTGSANWDGPSAGADEEVNVVESVDGLLPNEKGIHYLGAPNGRVVLRGNAFDFAQLPTSDPGIAGRAWVDSGVVKVSSG